MSRAFELLKQAEESLSTLRKVEREVSKEIELLSNELSKCDLEISDLLHYAECVNFSAVEGYKRFKELKDINIKRRDIKNDLGKLSCIHEKINEKLGTNNISSVIDTITDRTTYKDVTYQTRVRKDLQGKIDLSLAKLNRTRKVTVGIAR